MGKKPLVHVVLPNRNANYMKTEPGVRVKCLVLTIDAFHQAKKAKRLDCESFTKYQEPEICGTTGYSVYRPEITRSYLVPMSN